MTVPTLSRFVIAFALSIFWLLGNNLLFAQTDGSDPANVVVAIQGRLSLKRYGWTNYVPIAFGTWLQEGDLLDLGESSSAKVVCSDLSLHDVRMGIGAIPCSPSRPVLRRQDGSLIHATRDWPDDGAPIVLSPRKTRLLSPYPTLRWTEVKGAHTYHVYIRGLKFGLAGADTTATSFDYSAKDPTLEPGVDYKLIVAADGQAPSDEPGPDLGFSIVEPMEKALILQEEHQVESLKLPDGPTQFLVAYLYSTHRLYAEAIDRLEMVFPTFNVAAGKRLQADLYMKIGLPRQAESDYLVSLDLSRIENDKEGQMLDHKALSYVYELIGNRKASSQQLLETLDLARSLGDDFTARQAETRLAEIKAAAVRHTASKP